QGTLEDRPLTFSTATGNPLAVSDVDLIPGDELLVYLAVNHGTLRLARTDGLRMVFGGQGLPLMQFFGTAAAINAALDGLVYTPSPDFNGGDVLTLSTS